MRKTNQGVLYLCIVLCLATSVKAQQGFGTSTPDKSAVIDMVNPTPAANAKGALLPKVVLSSTTVAAPVTLPANGLTVFNTATDGTSPNNVVPGYYYWSTTASKWIRLVSSTDATTNSLALATNTLTSTVNGVAATASTVSAVVHTLTGNNLVTTVNGVASSDLDLTSLEPWQVQTGTAKANANGQNIYQTGSVAIGASTIPTFTAGAATITPKFHVAGDVSATGKFYTTNSVYADYVFEKYYDGFSSIDNRYTFKSLEETEQFIKANKHLPGVTPINETNKNANGYTFDITELSIQSLEKIEELFLHVIAQQQQLEAKEKALQVLQKQAIETNERLQRLENLLLKK